MPKLRTLEALLVFGAIVLLSSQAQAACRGGFCVGGSDSGPSYDGRVMHHVTFTTTLTNVSHFNYINPYGKQYELGANERAFDFLNLPSGQVEQYALQACSGGGAFQGSRCTPWASFTHTAP